MDEYVEMLIAAGWINAGDVDDEYQQYLKRGPQHDDDDDEDYATWKAWTSEFDELSEEFRQIESFLQRMGFISVWSTEGKYESEVARATHLCDEMRRYESWLRY